MKVTEINARVAVALSLLALVKRELCAPCLMPDRIEEDDAEVRVHLASDGVDRGMTIIFTVGRRGCGVGPIYWKYDRDERATPIRRDSIDHPFTNDD